MFEEPLRLPHAIGQASVAHSPIRTLLSPGRGSTAAFDYTLNAYRGCTFGCAYCYAPSFESRTDLAQKWGDWVEVKQLAIQELLGNDLNRKSIFMSSVTDPYQPIEAKIALTRSIVETLVRAKADLVVQTRSPLVVRDLDLIKRFRAPKVNISIPTHSDQVRRIYEPNAPSIESRFRTASKLSSAGITVSVCISPMLPVIDAEEFAAKIRDCGAHMCTASWFHASAKPFTASTRPLGFDLNNRLNWNYEQFQKARDVIREKCGCYVGGDRAFGPLS